MADNTPSGVTIERDAHTQQFVTLHNRVIRDKRLHRSSRGLLAEILSLPPDTRVSVETLLEGGPEKRDALRTMVTELEENGYITRLKGQDERGRWWTRLIVRETPKGASPAPDGPTPEDPASEKAASVPPAETEEIAGHAGDGFSDAGKSGAKDLKDEPLKDIKDGGDPSPGDLALAPADVLSRMIQGEIRQLTGGAITLGTAAAIGARLLAQRAEPPEHPVEWVRAILRAAPNPRKFLPTPTPAKFTAPPPARPVKAESIQAAHAAIAHLKRPVKAGTGDPLRDLATQQLAELRKNRNPDPDPDPGHPARNQEAA